MWAKRDLRRLEPVESALDLARGTMFFRRFLPADRYTGVDVLKERLDQGRLRHPDAQTICGKIEDLPSTITADIVICFETFGINAWFDNTATTRCVGKLIDATNKGRHGPFEHWPGCGSLARPSHQSFQRIFCGC